MPKPRRTAVSYSRFSHGKQADGDSEDRQDRDYRRFCERHDLTPGKEVYADRGRSGYKDEHRTKGRLGVLIRAAKSGAFDPGTVIVVEAWDRLGRLRPDRQTALVAELVATGVSIGVCQLDDIFADADFGGPKWHTLSAFISLAFNESKLKSERVAASWESRRRRAREGGALVGARLPAWVEKANGALRPIPERAAAVRRVFELAAAGLGHTKVIKALVAEGVPAFGERIVREGRTRSQFAGQWTRPYVARLLHDRRVLGEYQPLRRYADGRARGGEPVRDYFPRVVSDDLFALAQAALRRRGGSDSLGRAGGPRQGKYPNIFSGWLTHARDGGPMVLSNKGTAARPELLLVNASGSADAPRTYTIPYYVFEGEVLRHLREIDPASVLPRRESGPAPVEVLRAKLANVRRDLAGLKDGLRAGVSKTLLDLVREKEAEEEQVVNDLQDELARTARPLARSWDDLPPLIDVVRGADDPDAARLRLRPVLRAVVESAHVLIVPQKWWRLVAVQFRFTGGDVRSYLIRYRPATRSRPAEVSSCSFADAIRAGEFDLRDPDHVRDLEAALRAAAEPGKPG